MDDIELLKPTDAATTRGQRGRTAEPSSHDCGLQVFRSSEKVKLTTLWRPLAPTLHPLTRGGHLNTGNAGQARGGLSLEYYYLTSAELWYNSTSADWINKDVIRSKESPFLVPLCGYFYMFFIPTSIE